MKVGSIGHKDCFLPEYTTIKSMPGVVCAFLATRKVLFHSKMLLPQTAAVMQIENILPNRNKREAGEAALEMKCEPEE